MNRFQCPECHAFVSLASAIQKINNNVYCRNCGKSFYIDSALVAETRRAETRPLVAQGETFQNGPKGNALSLLLPNGKIKTTPTIKKDKYNISQLNLFGGAL